MVCACTVVASLAPLCLTATQAPARGALYLPSALSAAPAARPPALAARLARAAEVADPTVHFPAYDRGPSADAARANVRAACHDLPPLDEAFGPGAQRAACAVWMSNALGLWHAVRLARVPSGAGATGPEAVDGRWAAAYLEVAVAGLAVLAYGPGDGPEGPGTGGGGLRDTRGAVWQNTARLVDVVVVANALHGAGALPTALEARVTDLASAVARAWRAAWWETGATPGAVARLVTRTADAAPATSLAGAPVAAATAHAFAWDPDRGNSPAEEMAWMSAGVRAATRWLGDAIPAEEAEALDAAAAHYAAFALAAGRIDPRSGRPAWTLGRETGGGPYGQNALWLENHQPDVPSVPYLGVTWFYLATGALDRPAGAREPWAVDGGYDPWPVMRDAAAATVRAPDGRALLELTPGRRADFALAPFPAWTMPCGVQRDGALYVATGRTAPDAPRYVTETGEPAGMAILTAAVPLARAAAARGDDAAARLWRAHADAALDDLDDSAPALDDLGCAVAPWTAPNPAYHAASMAAQLSGLWRVAVGAGPNAGPRAAHRGPARPAPDLDR